MRKRETERDDTQSLTARDLSNSTHLPQIAVDDARGADREQHGSVAVFPNEQLRQLGPAAPRPQAAGVTVSRQPAGRSAEQRQQDGQQRN